MTKAKKITVFGSDKRSNHIYKQFVSDGYACKYITDPLLSEFQNTDILILPIPSFDKDECLNCTDITVYDLFNALKSETVIFAAKIPQIIKRIADEYKIHLYDYTDNEEFNILNAVATAEGTIIEIYKKTQKTILDSNYTVLGYGRIGHALSVRLKALGGYVTVGARSAVARAAAASDGLRSLTIEDAINSNNDSVIINTIPAPIINTDNIKNIKNTIIIDLASAPGGLTENAKMISGDNFIHALALPGKYYPETAGITIYKTIKSILQQTGDTL